MKVLISLHDTKGSPPPELVEAARVARQKAEDATAWVAVLDYRDPMFEGAIAAEATYWGEYHRLQRALKGYER